MPKTKLYLILSVAMTATAFIGFSFTYFTPLASGNYPAVAPVIHLHGWSFFLWYLLLPLQALLVASGRLRLHIALGTASVLLAAVMTFTGLVVASVRVSKAMASGSPGPLETFWESFGLVVTVGLVLFVGFYAAALAKRKSPEAHKRLMIVASASALPAAVFRILVAAGGYHWLNTPPWVLPAAIFLPNLINLAGAIRDFRTDRTVHRAYVIGLIVAVTLGIVGFALTTHPAGDIFRHLLAEFAGSVGLAY